MNLTETKKESNTVYAGRVLTVQQDTVILADGNIAGRDVVRHPGGVGVIALTENREVLLVRQYRYPFCEETLEIPAGKKEPGEDPLTAGRRELREETGYTADTFIPLGVLYPTPGYSDEIDHLFAAKGLHPGPAHPDDDEHLEPLTIPLAEAMTRLEQGDLPDAKTQIALLRLDRLLKQGVF